MCLTSYCHQQQHMAEHNGFDFGLFTVSWVMTARRDYQCWVADEGRVQ